MQQGTKIFSWVILMLYLAHRKWQRLISQASLTLTQFPLSRARKKWTSVEDRSRKLQGMGGSPRSIRGAALLVLGHAPWAAVTPSSEVVAGTTPGNPLMYEFACCHGLSVLSWNHYLCSSPPTPPRKPAWKTCPDRSNPSPA